ncbi:MAG TPA: nucleotidyltransferase family protein [Gaiellaceae bacterium]|nr:nucleotidyltransferase family protein [Gaiellaceae bacterium]
MEAILLAGGKAERLGEAAQGRPKALVLVAGRPIAAYQVALLAAAGVRRVVVSCAEGQGSSFARELAGLGSEIVTVEEPEPLGRGGGLRLAAEALAEPAECFALNGDELLDVDFAGLARRHDDLTPAATITVTRVRSPFGVVELSEDDVVTGFHEAPLLDDWVSCGVYVLGPEALARLPERGDHEATTFPELAGEGKLRAYRHEGLWITVNTPKDLRLAEKYVREHPEWLRPQAEQGNRA